MNTSYQLIVKTPQGAEKPSVHDVPQPGSFFGPLKIKAQSGARYQLVDNTTGQGPDNIRVRRVGQDLRISFEGREDVDVIITHYYESANLTVIGETAPNVFMHTCLNQAMRAWFWLALAMVRSARAWPWEGSRWLCRALPLAD
jgi:hypothetical protein